MSTKLYKHTCDRCRYIGTEGIYDFYRCDQSSFGETVVARYSNDPPGYIAAPENELRRIGPNQMRRALEVVLSLEEKR